MSFFAYKNIVWEILYSNFEENLFEVQFWIKELKFEPMKNNLLIFYPSHLKFHQKWSEMDHWVTH